MNINRAKIKTYFVGKSQLVPIILMILGLIIPGIGLLLVGAGIVLFIYNKFSPDLSGESEVDKAKEYEIECAKARALEKLNLISEQIENVEPVVVSGRANPPESSTGVIQKSFLKTLLKSFKLFKKDEYEDPVRMDRIGSEGKYRCSLLSTSVFMFGETQLYIYFSYVDLTTGLIYTEGTQEIFYSDINAMSLFQEKEKVYNYKKKRYEAILFESVKVFANGCSHTASLYTDLDKSVVDTQFNGMRNLIREKKNNN